MSILFDRDLYVEIWNTDKSEKFVFGKFAKNSTTSGQLSNNNTPYGKPHITANITKSVKDKNVGNFQLFNVSPSKRSELENADKNKYEVRVFAGYNGETFMIFKGDITKSGSVKQNADWVTFIESSDGANASAQAKLNKTYKANTHVKDIIKDALSSYGKDISYIIKDIKDDTIKNGFSISGITETIMDKIFAKLPKQELELNIQDGTAIVAPRGSILEPNNVAKISPDTGLIGTPNVTNNGVSIRTLVQNGLNPGRGIYIKCNSNEGANGIWVIQKTIYSLESRGIQWFADVDAIISKDSRVVV